MLFDDANKGIAQAYLSMLGESHFKVGDKVKCKASGMSGTVTKLDKEHGEDDDKYYTVKRNDGKEIKYAPNELSKMNEAMDPVNPKAVKKKFDNRMDKDIDNDGDVDSSDEYLHKRRKAISKSMAKEDMEIEIDKKKMKKNGEDEDDNDDEDSVVITNKKEKKEKGQMGEASCGSKMKKEDVEQVDELSKKTLGSYAKKAKDSSKISSTLAAYGPDKEKDKNLAKAHKRVSGMSKAVDRMTKEDVELDERVKTTHQNPLVTVHRNGKLHTHANLSTVNDIFGTNVKATDVHKKPVMAKSSEYGNVKFALSKHHDKEMKENVERVDENFKNKIASYMSGYSMAKTPRKEMDGNRPFIVYDVFHKGKKVGVVTEIGKNNWASGGIGKKDPNYSDRHKTKEDAFKALVKEKPHKMSESYQWNWDAILEAPEEEIDAMIEQMTDDELESFVTEFESIEEGNNWYQASTNSVQPMRPDGRETLDPRAEADRAFANAHRQQTKIKDYPGKDKPVNNAKGQAPARPGENRNAEPMKTLSDIRRR